MSSIHDLRFTIHRKLLKTNPTSQQLSELTKQSIGFRYNVYHKRFVMVSMPLHICDKPNIENVLKQTHQRYNLANRPKTLLVSDIRFNAKNLQFAEGL